MKYLFYLLFLGVTLISKGSCAVSVEDAWVRPANTDQNTAVYAHIKTDESTLSLIGAHTDVARLTEVHTHQEEGGIMKMRKVEALPCNQGSTLLKPGGDHIMLIGLTQDLRENENQLISVTFAFSNGVALVREVPVKRPKV